MYKSGTRALLARFRQSVSLARSRKKISRRGVRLAVQGACKISPQRIFAQDLDKSSVGKISAKCLLARSRKKISRRGVRLAVQGAYRRIGDLCRSCCTYPCARLAAQGANRSSPQLICKQDLDKSSVSKISAKCLLARPRKKISRRSLLANLYIVDMHTDNSQDPFCVEIYRKEAGRRVRGHRFVRASARCTDHF